jgi:uncharacterized membrane protein
MHFLKRFAQDRLRLTRIEAFSDGVFAIVVTLLVLELKVPSLQDHHSVSELGRQLLDLLPKFLSWLISFIIVCKFLIYLLTPLFFYRSDDKARRTGIKSLEFATFLRS